MQKTRQVLRLRSQGKGIKSISSLLSLARNTVKKYLSRLEESGLDFDSALFLSDIDLQSLLQEKPIVLVSTKQEISSIERSLSSGQDQVPFENETENDDEELGG
jgi:Response regulator containing a CheY-like receiver domain and an HTH DNA-binding domain